MEGSHDWSVAQTPHNCPCRAARQLTRQLLLRLPSTTRRESEFNCPGCNSLTNSYSETGNAENEIRGKAKEYLPLHCEDCIFSQARIMSNYTQPKDCSKYDLYIETSAGRSE